MNSGVCVRHRVKQRQLLKFRVTGQAISLINTLSVALISICEKIFTWVVALRHQIGLPAFDVASRNETNGALRALFGFKKARTSLFRSICKKNALCGWRRSGHMKKIYIKIYERDVSWTVNRTVWKKYAMKFLWSRDVNYGF